MCVCVCVCVSVSVSECECECECEYVCMCGMCGMCVRVSTLELRAVVALLSRDSLSERVTGEDIPASTSMAFTAALWNESEMVVGWMPGRSEREDKVRSTYSTIVSITIENHKN